VFEIVTFFVPQESTGSYDGENSINAWVVNVHGIGAFCIIF
jgi:hypothetical protein